MKNFPNAYIKDISAKRTKHPKKVKGKNNKKNKVAAENPETKRGEGRRKELDIVDNGANIKIDIQQRNNKRRESLHL